MNILITGGHGFLGKILAKKLACHHTVSCPARSELDLCDHAVTCGWFLQHCYDVVIHCATAGRNFTRNIDPAIVDANLRAFNNLIGHSHRFHRLINIASGAEFDLNNNIHLACEKDIWLCSPQHSYGFSKNIIARMVQLIPNAINLRLFGCFDSSESSNRPIKRCQELMRNDQAFVITGDKMFDMVSVDDFIMVLEAVLDGSIADKDINVVYNTKHTLSEILKLYCEIHGYCKNLIKVESTDEKNYTGNAKILQHSNLPLLGLHKSLEKYQ